MLKSIAHRWQGVGSAWPRGLFANGELGCWFDCQIGDAFADTARTTIANVATTVAGLADRSGLGVHAAQATSGLRPYLGRVPSGGRRNLLNWSADLANAAWGKTNCTVTAVGDGSFIFTDDATLGYHCVNSTILPADAALCARSIEVKKGTARYISLGTNSIPSAPATTSIFDLDTLAWTQVASAVTTLPAVALGGGWYRLTYVSAAATTSYRYLTIGTSQTPTGSGVGQQFAGIGDTVYLRNGQGELGSVATAFQTVVAGYSVTEAGKRDIWHLHSDLVNDTMVAMLPDLGSAATLFYAVDDSSVILPGQTIGAGAFEVLRGRRTFACGAINRALSAAETAVLTAYLNARRGA